MPVPELIEEVVSTHSRPKAAGTNKGYNMFAKSVSTHSRPKAAGSASSADVTVQ